MLTNLYNEFNKYCEAHVIDLDLLIELIISMWINSHKYFSDNNNLIVIEKNNS